MIVWVQRLIHEKMFNGTSNQRNINWSNNIPIILVNVRKWDKTKFWRDENKHEFLGAASRHIDCYSYSKEWSEILSSRMGHTFSPSNPSLIHTPLFFIVVDSLSHIRLFHDPIDCSPLGFFVHRILQARILEWTAISCFRGSSWSRD